MWITWGYVVRDTKRNYKKVGREERNRKFHQVTLCNQDCEIPEYKKE